MDFKGRGPNPNFGDRRGGPSTEVCVVFGSNMFHLTSPHHPKTSRQASIIYPVLNANVKIIFVPICHQYYLLFCLNHFKGCRSLFVCFFVCF